MLVFQKNRQKKSFTTVRTTLWSSFISKKVSGRFFLTVHWIPHIWISIWKCIPFWSASDFYLVNPAAHCERRIHFSRVPSKQIYQFSQTTENNKKRRENSIFFLGEHRDDFKTIRIRGIRSKYPDPNPRIRPFQVSG